MLSGKLRSATGGGAVGEAWTYVEDLSKNQTVYGNGLWPYVPWQGAWNGTEFWILSRQGGFATSYDGLTWELWPNAPVINNMRSVAFNGTQYLLGTFNSLDLFLFTTTDKITWTSCTTPLYNAFVSVGWTPNTGSGIQAVLWDGTQWVAMNSQGYVGKSTDLVTWTASNSLVTAKSTTTTDAVTILAYSGSVYVACVADAGTTAMYSSPDAVTWTNRVIIYQQYGISSIVWTGTKFVGVTYKGIIWISVDGITWTSNTNAQTATGYVDSTPAYYIVWDGTKLVVMRQSAYGNYQSTDLAANNAWAATSTDGVTWTSNTTLKNNATWQQRKPGVLMYGASRYVSMGDSSYTGAIYPMLEATSTDFNTWTFPTNLTQFDTTFSTNGIYKIYWTGSKYIAVGIYNCSFATSPNGYNSWTNNVSLFYNTSFNIGEARIEQSAYGLGKYIVCRRQGQGTSAVAYYTTDFINFTAIPSFATAFGTSSGSILGMWFAGSYFYASGGTSPYKFVYSPDGINWVASATGPSSVWGFGSAPILTIVWSGSRYLAWGNSNNFAATSTDGLTWTNSPSSTSLGVAVGYVTWAGNQFVVLDQNGRIGTSPDGVTWTYNPSLYNILLGTSRRVYNITWCDSFCIVQGDDGYVYKTYDFVNWTQNNSLMSTTWGTYKASYNGGGAFSSNWNGYQLILGGFDGRVAIS
jgi:hypothetical protein